MEWLKCSVPVPLNKSASHRKQALVIRVYIDIAHFNANIAHLRTHRVGLDLLLHRVVVGGELVVHPRHLPQGITIL